VIGQAYALDVTPKFLSCISVLPAWNRSDEEQVMCQECEVPTEMERVRLMSKTLGTFRCHKCHVTHQVMYRTLGAGLGKTMKCVPHDEKVEFFRFAKENCGGAVAEKTKTIINWSGGNCQLLVPSMV